MKKQSRQLGASKKDAFHHTTWNLDLRTEEEKEIQMQKQKQEESHPETEVGNEEHVYDDVCTTTTPVEIKTKVIQTDDIEKSDQMVQVQESKLELQDIEDNKQIDDYVNENNIDENHVNEEESNEEAMKLKRDIVEAVKAIPNINI